MEGFAATGEHDTAQKLGEAEGADFPDAVRNFIKTQPTSGPFQCRINEHKRENGSVYFEDWARRLFDNEADARKSFG